MRTLAMILVCLLVLAVGTGGVLVMLEFSKPAAKKDVEVLAPTVRSMVVTSISKRIDVETQGTVVPRREIALVAEVAGKVTEVSPSLASGGFFEIGEVLVELDDRDYELEVTRAKAQVAQAEVLLSREEAEAAIARREWKKLGEGRPTPLVLREPQVMEAKAGLAAAEAGLARARLDLERTTIRAPFAGRVRRKSVDLGQFVGRGAALAVVYGVDMAEVRLPIHDRELKYLNLPLDYRGEESNGNRVAAPTVTLQARFAQNDEQWLARIVRTEGEIDPKSRMLHVVARVLNPYGRGKESERPPLAVGMFVNATIHGKTFADVIEVPREAVRGRSQILVIDGEQRAHLRQVKVLHRGKNTVIVESGLVSGERICLSPLVTFVENMQVRVEEGR